MTPPVASVGRARIEALGGGRFLVTGVLDASTVVEVLGQSHERFPAAERLCIDLAGVTESDSAGLALLIEWLRVARQRGQSIEFLNLPAQVNALARISEIEDLLLANGVRTPAGEVGN